MVKKDEFIAKYAEMHDITKTRAKEEVSRFIDAFKQITYKEGGISITGFAESRVVTKEGREYKNPKTGKIGKSEAKTVVSLKIKPNFKNMES